MKIHEYQAKEILRRFGVATPRGEVTDQPDEARRICEELGGRCVVKAQIHAGGRGKGGGIRLAGSPAEAEERAREILGMRLVTPQTGPEGQTVRKVWVEEASDIARELYVSVTLDRARGMPLLMASKEGGMDIEEVAARSPEAILKEHVHPHLGLLPFQARNLAAGLGLAGDTAKAGRTLLAALVDCYLQTDASLVEINPLVVTGDGRVVALDAKLAFDDNALFRHPDVQEMRDLAEENPIEVEAGEHGLTYIKLDGSIGCMVNGAGLAMATMDIIKLSGGEPANFLDVGGGATKERVTAAFKLLLSDPKVEGVLVNIFGGIMRCDVIAEGIVAAAREVNIGVPLVVRLEGTNVDLGKQILQRSGLPITAATDLADAADKIVAAVQGVA